MKKKLLFDDEVLKKLPFNYSYVTEPLIQENQCKEGNKRENFTEVKELSSPQYFILPFHKPISKI